MMICRLSELMKFLVTIHENGFHDSWNRGVGLGGQTGAAAYLFLLFRRARRNWAYRVTSSRSFSSRSAVALRRAFVRGLGCASGKKTVIGTPKNRANPSKSEIDGL